MNEGPGATAAPVASAGRLLREARERQGLHIAALAASIKVAPKKLELLEADRFDALPDVTFTRALAQTVCRALKIDPAPILKLMPPPAAHRLQQVGEGLNAPFRERPGALVHDGTTLTIGPVFWITAFILIATLVVYLLPAGSIGWAGWRGHAASAADARGAASATVAAGEAAATNAALPAPAGTAASNEIPAATAPAEATASSALARAETAAAARALPVDPSAAPGGVIQLRTSAPSWIEVTDSRGQSLLARLVQPGEALGIDGVAPFRVRIGNAAGTRLSFRGQPMELAANTRDNVASLELK